MPTINRWLLKIAKALGYDVCPCYGKWASCAKAASSAPRREGAQ